MTQAQRQRFERAQAAYRAAYERLSDFEIQLHSRYGPGLQDSWLSGAHRKKRTQLRAARDRAGDRVSAALEASPRDWSRGVPAHWIYSELSAEDAFRPLSEPLSVTPPRAYGYAENPTSGALIVGGIAAAAILAWVFWPKKAEAAPTKPTCATEHEVKSFIASKGLVVVLVNIIPALAPRTGFNTETGRLYNTTDCSFYRYVSTWEKDAALNTEFAAWK